jgi:hypothetical protein
MTATLKVQHGRFLTAEVDEKLDLARGVCAVTCALARCTRSDWA